MADLPDIVNQQWDVIIVGTGVGGATLGYALAKAGKKVLFCEKGRSHLDSAAALRGDYAENHFVRPDVPRAIHRDTLARAGRWCDELEDATLPPARKFIPFIGSGTGGSSALYGMALERFFPSDFTPKRNYPDATETTLPEAWPISYETLAPYYKAAEVLYRVRGSGDPLRIEPEPAHFLQPPPLTAGASELFDFFKARGLHPYRLPAACEYVPGCHCCQGYLCPNKCKNDSGRICLEPALTQYGAQLLGDCEVMRLDASRNKITGALCTLRGQQFTIRAKTVILAAGALETPAILLRSRSDVWPNGLANESGMVGKNLMRHHIDLYLLKPRTRGKQDNRHKELAFNDFYHKDGKKMGSVQSFGRLPPASILVESMEQDIRDSQTSWVAAPFKLLKPFLKPVLNRMVTESMVLATILEDLPYETNKIELAPDKAARLSMRYAVNPYDQGRIDSFRALMGSILKPYRVKLIKQAENNQRIAHACGTCRFGHNPKQNVLDRNNRAHGLTNLYVVDSSFFPSSGGTNPSLSIAANALRVAEHLVSDYPA
jgi:choline dehydrogenase-like flavoprotein